MSKKRNRRDRRRAAAARGRPSSEAMLEVPEGEEDGQDERDGSAQREGGRRAGPLRPLDSRTGTRQGGSPTGRARPRTAPRSSRPASRGRRVLLEPQPPILAPLARSLVLVGRSPVILGVAFAGVLVIWAIYSSSGVVRIASPATMGQIQSLPPVHSFVDLEFMFTGLRVFSGPVLIGLGAVLLLLRSAFLALLLALIQGSFAEGSEPLAAGSASASAWRSAASWRAELKAAAIQARGSFQYVFAVEAVLMVTVYALYTILSLFFGALGLVLALLLGLYLLALAPVVAAAERLGIGASTRLSVRAARLRGPQQLMLSLIYVFIFVSLVFGLRSAPAAPATPSVLVWAYVLFATYVHLAILATITYRWFLVREVVGVQEELAGPPRLSDDPAR